MDCGEGSACIVYASTKWNARYSHSARCLFPRKIVLVWPSTDQVHKICGYRPSPLWLQLFWGINAYWWIIIGEYQTEVWRIFILIKFTSLVGFVTYKKRWVLGASSWTALLVNDNVVYFFTRSPYFLFHSSLGFYTYKCLLCIWRYTLHPTPLQKSGKCMLWVNTLNVIMMSDCLGLGHHYYSSRI